METKWIDTMSKGDSRRLKLTIEYDGTDFHGWQLQPNDRTVQGELEAAFSTMLQESARITGAGRTDAGVHAQEQVAHLDVNNMSFSCERIKRGINSLLPDDVKLLMVEEAAPDFHSRFQAVSRSYLYSIIREKHPLKRRFAWFPDCSWDDEMIARTALVLEGEHSFRSFCCARPGETDYLCDVKEIDWIGDVEGAELWITADRFFHQMVRGIVGALIDVGRGFLDRTKIEEMLLRPKENAVVNFAPAHGLTLMEVRY